MIQLPGEDWKRERDRKDRKKKERSEEWECEMKWSQERERGKKTVDTFNTVNVTLWYFLSLVVFSLCVTFPSFKLSRSTHHYWVERGNRMNMESSRREKRGRENWMIHSYSPEYLVYPERATYLSPFLPIAIISLFPTLHFFHFPLVSSFFSSHSLTFSFSLLARITFLFFEIIKWMNLKSYPTIILEFWSSLSLSFLNQLTQVPLFHLWLIHSLSLSLLFSFFLFLFLSHSLTHLFGTRWTFSSPWLIPLIERFL